MGAARIRARQRGFTLVELLAALVVFGFVIAALVEGIRIGLAGWRAETETVTRDADLDEVDRVVARLLTVTSPVGFTGAGNVIGTAHELAFTTTLPVRIGDPPTPLADARLYVKDGVLCLDLAPHYHATRVGPAPLPRTERLVSGVDRLTIAYWLQGGTSWRTTWDVQATPSIIRLSVAFTDPRRHWPPIVAAPILSRYAQ